MTPEQFAYWLQGFAEMSAETPPTPEQWECIKAHLGSVFKKTTPTYQGVKTLFPPGPFFPPSRDRPIC